MLVALRLLSFNNIKSMRKFNSSLIEWPWSLSPLLFILCFEVFSRLMGRKEAGGNVHGIRIARNAPAVSHLLYADDLLVMWRANRSDATSFRTLEGVLISIALGWGKRQIWRNQMSKNTKSTDKREILETTDLQASGGWVFDNWKVLQHHGCDSLLF